MNHRVGSRSGDTGLSFRLGHIPVRIHLWVLVAPALMALGPWSLTGRVIAFVAAVLAHELGRAAAARSFGLPAELDLSFSWGSLASRLASLSRGRRIAVCAAGPAANLGLAAATFALVRMHSVGQAVGGALSYFAFINLGWGVIHMLPVFPFDGGYALAAALDRATRGQGEQTVRWLSIFGALIVGAAALASKMVVIAALCALISAPSVWALHVARNRRSLDTMTRLHLQAAYDALERGEATTAKHHCLLLLSLGARPDVRKDAVRLLAYAYATSDDWVHFMALIEEGGAALLPEPELDNYEWAAAALGRAADARRIAVLRGRFA